MKSASKFYLVFLLLSGLLSSALLFRQLTQEPFLRGSDAYYYALQANYWAKTGKVKIPDDSPIHRATGSLQKLGFSTENSVRFWEAASLFLFFVMTLGLVLRFDGPSFSACLLFLYGIFSPALLFTDLEFPKFFSFVIFIPLWFYPLKPDSKKGWLAILLAALTSLLHRGALPLAFLFSAALLFIWFGKGALRKGKTYLFLLGTAALLILLAKVVLKDSIQLLDLNRLSFHQIQPSFFALLRRQNLPLAIKLELAFVPLIFLFFAFCFWKNFPNARRELCLPAALALPAFFPLGQDEVLGAGERYALLLPILLLISAIYLSEKYRRPEKTSWLKMALVTGLALFLPVSTEARLEWAHPKRLDPPNEIFEALTQELKEQNIPMLIAHKGFMFYYKFRLMREAFPYEPEPHWNKTRIWRLVVGLTPEALNYYLPETCRWESGLLRALAVSDYFLLREDCWQDMRTKITRDEDPDLYQRVWENPLNPSQKRPAFLYPKHRQDDDPDFPAFAPLQ